MKIEKSLISICIPTLNGGEFIKEAIESAIFQTYRPLEIVISDDNSNDRTLEIVKSFRGLTDIPISIFHHTPSGIGANWNNCVINSSGKYIKFLFQDDLFINKECISKMVELAETNSELGLVFCRRRIVTENRDFDVWIKDHGNLHLAWTKLDAIQRGKYLLKDKRLLNSPLNKIGEPTCVLLKKEVFSKVGYFNTKAKQILDLVYWVRVFKYYTIGFIDEELVAFRRHNNQATEKNKSFSETPLLAWSLLRNCFWQIDWNAKGKILYIILRDLIRKSLINTGLLERS